MLNPAGDLLLAFEPRGFRPAPDNRVGDQGVVIRVSQDHELLLPAAGLARRALALHAEEGWNEWDEATARALAPISPEANLTGIRDMVNNLLRT